MKVVEWVAGKILVGVDWVGVEGVFKGIFEHLFGICYSNTFRFSPKILLWFTTSCCLSAIYILYSLFSILVDSRWNLSSFIANPSSMTLLAFSKLLILVDLDVFLNCSAMPLSFAALFYVSFYCSFFCKTRLFDRKK